MKNRYLIAALFLGTALATVAHAAPATVDRLDCRNNVPAAFLATHPVNQCWKKPRGKPAFDTVQEAMDGREKIFSQFQDDQGVPRSPEWVAAAIQATNKPAGIIGVTDDKGMIRITDRNWFNDMAEGGFVVKHGVLADFSTYELQGRLTLEEGGVYLEAYAWEFTFEGKRYRIFLPVVCRNWADKVYAVKIQLPPPPPPSPNDDCVQEAYKMNAGDSIQWGVAADQDLPLSWCTAQQKPGETRFETNFVEEPCDHGYGVRCSLDKPAADLGKPLLAHPRSSFTATTNGYFIVRLPRAVVDQAGVWDSVACLYFHDSHRGYGNHIASTDFTAGQAYVVFHALEKPPVNWSGIAHEWHFLPFEGEPNHR